MINIKSKCGEIFHADEKFVGKKIKCPKCGEILTIQLSEVPKQKISEIYKTPPYTGTTQTQKTNYAPTKKSKNDLKRFAPLLILLLILSVIFIGYLSEKKSSSNDNPSIVDKDNTDNYESRPESGNVFDEKLNPSDNSSSTQSSVPPVDSFADWNKVDLQTGTSPACFNFTPTFDKKIDNKLEVNVGSNTDVVIKLCSYTTGRCIRYVYVRSGETYNITNIPQDKYYIKIAYGTDWRQKVVDEQCVGKFVHNALYKKGDQVLDFHKEFKGTTIDGDHKTTHFTVPWFSLSLDVVATDFDPNTFHTNSISEEEFNK